MQKFSPCSQRAIGISLESRAPLCFDSLAETQSGFCGNLRVDVGETCDVGGGGSKNDREIEVESGEPGDGDPCCSSHCQLRPGAQCSPLNHECCTKANSFLFFHLMTPVFPFLGNFYPFYYIQLILIVASKQEAGLSFDWLLQ
ncbi:unnamed protein product [Protopolystoma xenopodis]|uniref:Disintegrin domain-containing protein n=1 Tax=Protopolystoma xenopodis TaxID=117903 RepID=A0A448X4H9_9PLAT|nr:unnamed protein product [Protopolystoma xenopodis]